MLADPSRCMRKEGEERGCRRALDAQPHWLLNSAWSTTRIPVAHRYHHHAVGLIPVSARELLTILQATTLPPLRHDIDHVLYRSAWRRRHQATAQTCRQRWNNITTAATT